MQITHDEILEKLLGLTPAPQAEGDEPCPGKVGCLFLGRYMEADGSCWCVYWCPAVGYVTEPCP